ncbi:hypothetical protein [Blastococcus sp. DSM 46786]|nr:hypothetical protein [Blastococcus sp. DSM 46786]
MPPDVAPGFRLFLPEDVGHTVVDSDDPSVHDTARDVRVPA